MLQEQFDILLKPITEPLMGTKEKPGVLPVYAIACLIAEYVSRNLFNWYEVLKKINMVNFKAPPLRSDIYQILNSICPIYNEPVDMNQSLYLVPPGTIMELVLHAEAYGKKHLKEYDGKNPFHLSFCTAPLIQEHENTPNDVPQWRLVPNEILRDSRYKSFKQQIQMVEEISKKSLIPYTAPSLKEIVSITFFHRIITGITIFKKRDPVHVNRFSSIYSCLQETCKGERLIAGSYAPTGFIVSTHNDHHGCDCVGILPVGILS